MLQLKSPTRLQRFFLLAAPAFSLFASSAFPQGSYTDSGSWSTQRYRTDFVRLLDGRIYVAGGQHIDSGYVTVEGSFSRGNFTAHALSSAEIFDPSTHTSSPAPNITQARYAGATTVLADGRVAIFGGESNTGATFLCDKIELYDPAQNKVFLAGYFAKPRVQCSAITLNDGRVLLVGGKDDAINWPTSFVVFTFSATGVAQTTIPIPAADSQTPRRGQRLITLDDGRVLIAGGRIQYNAESRSEMYVFNPATNTISFVGHMSVGRFQHAVTRMADGRIFISGGYTDNNAAAPTRSCDVFDPAENRMVASYQMNTARAGHWLALLDDSRILINGQEIFDPRDSTFTAASPTPTQARVDGTAIKLLDGRFFLTGGISNNWPQLRTEIYTPAGWSANRPPVADAGQQQIIYADNNPSALVTLNGAASSDPDGQVLSYSWTTPFGSATGVTPIVSLPIGIHTITLTVTDPENASSSATTNVAVVHGISPARHAELLAQIDSLTSENTTLLGELQAANNTVASLLEDKRELEGLLIKANEEIARLTSLLAAATADNTRLAAELQTERNLTNTLRAQLATLEQELEAAQSQITALGAENTALRAAAEQCATANAALTAQIIVLRDLLRTAFGDPDFQIPGSTPQQQLENLVAAIDALNPGQKRALYKNLGGQN